MVTWDDVERAHEARVAELTVDIERRVESRVWLQIAEQLHASSWAEVERCERALHLALLRTQRARRRWERVTRHMRVVQRTYARAHATRLARDELDEIAVREAARRVEVEHGPR